MQSARDDSRQGGNVAATPAGRDRQDPARGGEFKRNLTGLELLASEITELADECQPNTPGDDVSRARRLQLRNDAALVRWAIEELSRHDR